MGRGIYVAASGSMAKLRQLEVLSNNLANSRTAGFKGDRVTFQQVDAAQGPRAAHAHAGVRDKHFVDVRDVDPQITQGPITQTANPLDVAITGNGFLKVRTEDGVRLTRNGRLMLGRDGTLRTLQGHTVLDPQDRPILLPPDRIPQIDDRGVITSEGREVGRLGVGTADPAVGLRKDVHGLFHPPEVNVAARPETAIMQGYLEESNVNPVRMMLELIEVQRAFSALRQVITTSGEMDALAARLPQ